MYTTELSSNEYRGSFRGYLYFNNQSPLGTAAVVQAIEEGEGTSEQEKGFLSVSSYILYKWRGLLRMSQILVENGIFHCVGMS